MVDLDLELCLKFVQVELGVQSLGRFESLPICNLYFSLRLFSIVVVRFFNFQG